MQLKSKIASCVIGTGIVAGLVIAGSTSADAKSFIHGSDIAHSTITGYNVKNSSLTGSDIKNNSITSADIASGGVGSSEIRNGSVGTSDLSSSAIRALSGKTGATGHTGATGKTGLTGKMGLTGLPGANGTPGKPGADAFVTSGSMPFGPTVIASVGGSWKNTNTTGGSGHTNLGKVPLKAGTYMLTVSSDFWKSSATDALPQIQVQVNKSGFAADAFPSSTYITTFATAPASTTANADRSKAGVLEQTSSGYALVTLAADTTVEVDAFGYNANQGSAGSGDFTVASTLSWVQINAKS